MRFVPNRWGRSRRDRRQTGSRRQQKSPPRVLIEHGRDGWLSERQMRYELDLNLTPGAYQNFKMMATRFAGNVPQTTNYLADLSFL
jgi:hypothetical protein